MFDSGVTAQELIKQVQDEADISLDISLDTYVTILNSIEQLLYSEIILEQSELIVLEGISRNMIIDIESLPAPEDEQPVRYEDIYTVYADTNQLIEAGFASKDIFPNIYYKKGTDLICSMDFDPEQITIVYHVRPKIKQIIADNVQGNVMIPLEFIDLIKAKMRGEIYKIANEDAIAAKWLSDYNVLLETFKSWCAAKNSQFGMNR